MSDDKNIHGIKRIEMYATSMKKLTVNPKELSEEEKTYLLTCAIILLKKYDKDKRHTLFVELAYFIILRYSLSFSDFEPLYDFSVNMGFYPIAHALASEELLKFQNITFSLVNQKIENEYSRGDIIETYEQKIAREKVVSSENREISFVAPTSFGKSSIIVEDIVAHSELYHKIGIIVPTKSLLMQTYRNIRREKLGVKLMIHDEMYNGEEEFIAVFTQERALRLLEKNDLYFDVLYIDEAHRLLDRDSRSILLSRLIKLNQIRNKKMKVVYLSPLVTESNNLKISSKDNIFEQRINFNIKEPEYFEYRLDKTVHKYNRFVDTFYQIGSETGMFEYIRKHKTSKTFCYLYSPKKIEAFAEMLAEESSEIKIGSEVKNIIDSLSKYVHEDFYAIEFIKKGIVYLHGKIPDNVKDYLEYKFSKVPEINFLVANKVVLEGINLPIDSLFVLNGTNLHGKELTNLIGRVNRLNLVFESGKSNLNKLIPTIHFVNSEMYNRKRSNLSNKIKLLKNSSFPDNIKNPLLSEFDFSQFDDGNEPELKKKCEEIVGNENIVFSSSEDSIQILKKKMISLGINNIYSITDDLCIILSDRIAKTVKLDNTEVHFLDLLRNIFVVDLEDSIIDQEFERLKYEEAISYYKVFFENRKKSLKENISREIAYFIKKAASLESRLYIGESYGEIPYETEGRNFFRKVYVDLKDKNKQQMANLAIVKQKMEEDFISYKLHMFFQLMYDYSIISEENYNYILYGTNDAKKLSLIKFGLTINIINRLEEDDQLKNIFIDKYNNLYCDEKFEEYRTEVDDFYSFELGKFL